VATGIEEPLDGDIHVSSFRLDQPLMNRLIGVFPHERARAFMRAFFPEAATSLDAYAEATRARTAFVGAGNESVQFLERAKTALTLLGGWRSGTATPTSEAFPVLLNAWLDKTALADLAQRARSVRATLEAARTAGWQPRDGIVSRTVAGLDAMAIDVSTLQRREQAWNAEIDELQKKLASFRPPTTAIALPGGPALSVDEQQVEALNAVSHWLFPEETVQSFGLFGEKLRKVINAGDGATYGTIVIGLDDWAAPALSKLDALLQAWADLRTERPPAPWPGVGVCAAYDAAAAAQGTFVETGTQLSARFIDKLRADDGATGEFDGSLITAVNELMALFTPARWGYEDVQLPHQLADGALGLGIEMGKGVRAELLLNTAELNLFTVALFFLCTSRVRKPLGVLVLDDPLQNMDELTSTALARGLAKLVRLWRALGRREEVLMLFHGYDDLERFRAELAGAIYRLPWLSPSSTAERVEIGAEPSAAGSLAVQSIYRMLEAR
jgi:hypothetical protein